MRIDRLCARTFGPAAWMILLAAPAALAQNAPKADLVATTEARTPDEEKQGFHLPPGFEMQLVAAEPDIHKPMNLAFDDRGRLWVTSTVEYPYPAKDPSKARDCIKILEDFDENGRARKITTFAEGLNIPIGILPLGHGALVHSIPNILYLSDEDGDGRADKREVYYSSIGFADTHGMANAFSWGFDGWIYACHGFANNSTIAGRDGKSITLNSGNTYRLRPDGSHIEQFTWGQVNPFGLTFDPLGNLYSCDCHSRPIFQLLRGAYYSSFGKPDDGLGYGPEMMSHDHYSTGIAGITYYDADHFPEAWRGTIFVGNVVTSRINHDRLEWHGSSPRAIEQPDFVVSDDPWFRPVDFELGPDGAIYVADFYNRIIGHYEVPLTHPGRDRERGRIWRIVYRGPDGTNKPVSPRPDWTKATADELVQDLAHPNIAVRIRAANQMVLRGGTAEKQAARSVAATSGSPSAKVHALWVLHRLGILENDLLGSAARDAAREVRVHAQRILSESDSLDAPREAIALSGLKDADPAVRRAAADALGQHPAPSHLHPLIEARKAAAQDDTHFVHVVRMALRNQLKPDASWTALADGTFSPSDLATIADVSTGAPSRNAAKFLLEQIRREPGTAEVLDRYVHHIARYGDPELDRGLLAFVRRSDPNNAARQAGLLKSLQRGLQERGTPLPDDVSKYAVDVTRRLLASAQGYDVSVGIDLSDALKLKEARDPLTRLATSAQTPEPQRIASLNALTAIEPPNAIPVLRQVLENSKEPIGLREHSANALARLNQEPSRAALLEVLPIAPGRLQTTIAAGLAGNREGADALLKLIEAGKASARLLQERSVQVWLNQSNLPGLADRIAKLTAGLEPADQKLQELIERRRASFKAHSGDAKLGAEVFAKNCAICHQIGGKGAKIGPQLDGVGIRGTDRVLEDVLDPNRNVDQAFRMMTVALDNGQVVSGLLLREEGEILVLADSQGKEVRVAKDTVEERKLSQLSPMPANLSEQINETDFNNLIAYLLSQTLRPEK